MEWLMGGPSGEIKHLVSQLDDPKKRNHAAQEILKMGAPAVPVLIQSLTATDDEASDPISELLIRLGPSAVPALCQGLTTTHPLVRCRLAWILGKIHDQSAVPALVAALKGEYFTVRAKAALALGTVGDPEAIGALVPALRDPEVNVRIAACTGLGQLADPQSFDAIGSVLLNDPEISVRQAAAECLGQTRKAEAIPYLMDALHDSFWWYERSDNAIDPLLDAIEKIGALSVPELITALMDHEGTVRRFSAVLLGRIRDPRAVEPLSLSLYDTHYEVGRESANALAAIGGPALRILTRALQHPEAWIRQQAVIAVTRSGDPETAALLPGMLTDENREVRKQVIQALGILRDPQGVAALEELAASRSDRELAALAKGALKQQE